MYLFKAKLKLEDSVKVLVKSEDCDTDFSSGFEKFEDCSGTWEIPKKLLPSGETAFTDHHVDITCGILIIVIKYCH